MRFEWKRVEKGGRRDVGRRKLRCWGRFQKRDHYLLSGLLRSRALERMGMHEVRGRRWSKSGGNFRIREEGGDKEQQLQLPCNL